MKASMGMRITAALALVSATGSAAQNLERVSTDTLPAIFVEESGPDCQGGIKYDDGSFEDGYGFTSTTTVGTYAMEFYLPGSTNRIDAVCICWMSLGGSSLDHRLKIWAADGPEDAPGTLLAGLGLPTVTVTGLSATPKWFRYTIPGGVVVPTDRVFLAPTWSPSAFPNRFLCADENGPGHQHGYAGTSLIDLKPTVRIGVPGSFPEYRALGLRAEAVPLGHCVSSDSVLCLNGGRFRVTATYRTAQGQSGEAAVVRLTPETGYLWFFGPTNVEAVIKVLNGCGVNGHFWVFAGGLTDVEVEITVIDTRDAVARTYRNPLGTQFAPIQDTGAFPGCP